MKREPKKYISINNDGPSNHFFLKLFPFSFAFLQISNLNGKRTRKNSFRPLFNQNKRYHFDGAQFGKEGGPMFVRRKLNERRTKNRKTKSTQN